jgi:hypothetical protein
MANQKPQLKRGDDALWHRRGLLPRPVFVVKILPERVRVLDLCEGDARHLKFRDLDPRNLTERPAPRKAVARG